MRIFCLIFFLLVSSLCVTCAADLVDGSARQQYQPKTFKFVEKAPEEDMNLVKNDAMKDYKYRLELIGKLKVNGEDANATFIKRQEEWATDLADLVRRIDENHLTDPFKARSELWGITAKYMPGDYQ